MTKILSELSKKILGSYIKKASADSVQHHADASMYTRLANGAVKGSKVPMHKAQDKANYHSRKHLNRATNIPKAVEKLVSEMLGNSHPRKAYLQPDERQKYTNAVSRPLAQRTKYRYVRRLKLKENKKPGKNGEKVIVNPDKEEILKGQLN